MRCFVWLFLAATIVGCASRVPEVTKLPVEEVDQRPVVAEPHPSDAPQADEPIAEAPTAAEPAERQVAHVEPAPIKTSKSVKADPVEPPLGKEELAKLVKTLVAEELAARDKQQALAAPKQPSAAEVEAAAAEVRKQQEQAAAAEQDAAQRDDEALARFLLLPDELERVERVKKKLASESIWGLSVQDIDFAAAGLASPLLRDDLSAAATRFDPNLEMDVLSQKMKLTPEEKIQFATMTLVERQQFMEFVEGLGTDKPSVMSDRYPARVHPAIPLHPQAALGASAPDQAGTLNVRRPTISQVLAALVVALLATWDTTLTVAAADELTALTAADGPSLHEYLLSEVARQYAAQRDEVAQAVTSPEGVAARRDVLRKKLRTIVGDLPERTPLNARTVGTIACDGYRIEKVLYESRPGHHVTANLYLPALATPTSRVPGVLVPCGHSDNGKASGPYQSVCILLAKNGCAALIYDPIGQGERNQIAELKRMARTSTRWWASAALLVGWNTANYRVWDGLRSMDYLASRAEVDPARLGMHGQLGRRHDDHLADGRRRADRRGRAVAASSRPSSGCSTPSVRRTASSIFPTRDRSASTTPTLSPCGRHEPTLDPGRRARFLRYRRHAHRVCRMRQTCIACSASREQVGLFSSTTNTASASPRREAAVAWMRRWLAGDERTVVDDEPPVRSNGELQVTPRARCSSEFAGEVSVVDLAKRPGRASWSRCGKPTWQALDDAGRVAAVRRAVRLPHTLELAARVEVRGNLIDQPSRSRSWRSCARVACRWRPWSVAPSSQPTRSCRRSCTSTAAARRLSGGRWPCRTARPARSHSARHRPQRLGRNGRRRQGGQVSQRRVSHRDDRHARRPAAGRSQGRRSVGRPRGTGEAARHRPGDDSL